MASSDGNPFPRPAIEANHFPLRYGEYCEDAFKNHAIPKPCGQNGAESLCWLHRQTWLCGDAHCYQSERRGYWLSFRGPYPRPDFVLQQNTKLAPTNLDRRDDKTILNLTRPQVEVSVPLAATNRFFRLCH